MSASRPFFPSKRTFINTVCTSALCQFPTFVALRYDAGERESHDTTRALVSSYNGTNG